MVGRGSNLNSNKFNLNFKTLTPSDIDTPGTDGDELCP